MPIIDPADEKRIREALKIKAQKPGVLGADFPVFSSQLFISSESDLVEKIGVLTGTDEATQTRIYKYLLITLAGIDDAEVEDNCPGLSLTYNFRLFVGFYPDAPPGSIYENSTEEFNSSLILLRNEFSLNETVAGSLENTTNDALARENFILLDVDPFTGIEGHFQDNTTRVETF